MLVTSVLEPRAATRRELLQAPSTITQRHFVYIFRETQFHASDGLTKGHFTTIEYAMTTSQAHAVHLRVVVLRIQIHVWKFIQIVQSLPTWNALECIPETPVPALNRV